MFQIYALIDPRSGEAHYIGHTRQALQERARGHKHGDPPYVGAWVAELARDGAAPCIIAIDQARLYREARALEVFWIIRYLENGAPLLNRCVDVAVHKRLRRMKVNHANG